MEEIQETWENITIESAQFVLKQAERRMQSTIDVAKSLTDKSVHVMQLSIPLSIALIGWIVVDPNRGLIWFYAAVLVVSMTITYISLRVYEGHDVKYMGYKPSQLLNDSFPFEAKNQRAAILIAVLKDVEERIAVGVQENRARERSLTLAILLVKALLLFSGVLFSMGLVFPLLSAGHPFR
jgi:hypothetical protein